METNGKSKKHFRIRLSDTDPAEWDVYSNVIHMTVSETELENILNLNVELFIVIDDYGVTHA